MVKMILQNADKSLVGQMEGELKDIETESSDENEEDAEVEQVTKSQTKVTSNEGSNKGTSFGFLSGLRSLVGSKTLTEADIQPVLEKMRDHLIAKNVAADIADSLCKSIAKKA
jgi:signal recognition particle receptor subunit alpha